MRTVVYGLAVVILIVALLSWRGGCFSPRSVRDDARTANVTGQQLDKVAKEVPAIREEQKEKQDEVEKIEGADQPLPPGFGTELERVRKRPQNTR